jgi:hypothetical protein
MSRYVLTIGADRAGKSALVALAALASLAMSASGQVPMPPSPPISGGTLSGIVRDAAGAPMADVNVTLVGETAATRTDSTGSFALRDVPPGAHTALFRRLGYRSVEYRWTARSEVNLQIAVSMTPVPRQLDRVVVEARSGSRRRGTSSIGGTITDSAGRSVAGADVRLLGSGLSTVTDEEGRFEFGLLAAGSYIVRVRRNGLRSANTVVQILDDDNRGISIKMFGLPKNSPRDTATASGYGIPDIGYDAFDRRTRSGGFVTAVVGPADLTRANRAPLDMLLQQYRDRSSARPSRPASGRDGPRESGDGDCLLIDGRRAVYQPLHTYTSVEVQLVEVFRANSFVDSFVVSQMDGLKECRGTMDRHPSYFVLWTRAMR